VNAHLQIFARLAHALQDARFSQAIARRAGTEELLVEAARIDAAAMAAADAES
jgi:hypothetical protein